MFCGILSFHLARPLVCFDNSVQSTSSLRVMSFISAMSSISEVMISFFFSSRFLLHLWMCSMTAQRPREEESQH